MDYTIIIRPLIGAGIGYITNWIAVKMLFRPLKPIKFGKHAFPFTPGIIPKNKARIAESIGETISENLLTEETLKQALLSEEMKQVLKYKIIETLNSISEKEFTFKEFIFQYVSESSYNICLKNIKEKLTENIFETIVNYDIGKIIAEQIEISAKEKLKGSVLGIFGGNSIISSISETASLKVNDYINKNGKELIGDMVSNQLDKYENMQISELSNEIANSDIDLTELLMNMYEKIIIEKIPNILSALNISKIIENKINAMDMLEVEKLILNIMKKELNALVNLGAIIGFILGLLNLIF